MTPKEKAFILVNQFHNVKPLEDDCNITMYEAKQCAIIAVDEILNYLTTSENIMTSIYAVNEWQEVKQEIEKL